MTNLVFCRGCAKQIHESAVACPNCGATQGLAAAKTSSGSRSAGMVFLAACGWVLAIWFVTIIAAGAIAGMLNPSDAEQAGKRAGESLAGVVFIAAIVLSGTLSALGVLPGTKRH